LAARRCSVGTSVSGSLSSAMRIMGRACGDQAGMKTAIVAGELAPPVAWSLYDNLEIHVILTQRPLTHKE